MKKKFLLLIITFLVAIPFYSNNVSAASQLAKANTVTFTNFNLLVGGKTVDTNTQLFLWTYMDWDFELTIDNRNKTLKNGDKITKEIVIGPWAKSDYIRFPTNTINITGENGVTYGTMSISEGKQQSPQTKATITITLNNNVTSITSVKAKVNMPRYGQYVNTEFDNVLYPFNFTIDSLTIPLQGKSLLLSESANPKDAEFRTESTLNKLDTHIFSHGGYLTSIGHTYELPEYSDAKMSYFMEGDYASLSLVGLSSRLYRPIASNSTDNRVGTYNSASRTVLNYMTQLTQNPGETWADFKNRVYSKKYQMGRYISSTGFGIAINMGDFTDKGWKDGNPNILQLWGFSSIEEFALSIYGNGNPTLLNTFARIYGSNGRTKGGQVYLALSQSMNFNNYVGEQNRNFVYEASYIPKGGTSPITKIENHTAKVLSTQYSVNVSEGQIVAQVSDKDSGALLPNVGVSLVAVSSNTSSSKNTNSGGLVDFSNLYPGNYKLNVSNIPSGYQAKLVFSNGNNNTSVNSNGELTLANKGSAFVKIQLEKIKYQAVNFTVKDTADKPIVGEIFSINRNGAFIAEYPTNAQGVFSIARLNSGVYSLNPTNPLRTGARAFVVEEGKTNTLEVEAVLPVIPEITANGPNSINLGNVTIGDSSNSTIPLNITYKGDSGYIVSVKKSENTNVEIKLNDTVITTQEKELTNLSGTANPVTTMINYQLNAKPTSTATKGSKSTNIIFSFKYKL